MASKSSFKNMVVVLTAICLIASALLAVVYNVTAEPIAKAEVAKVNAAISAVVPEFDNVPSEEVFEIEDGAKVSKVYPAKKGGEIVGYAVEVKSGGFGGPIQIMVGFTPDGIIYNTSIVAASNETPGLGAKILDDNIPIRVQMKNLNPATTPLVVKNDGGSIDAITASTITSRGFLKGVEAAYGVFLKIQAK
ncbi:MAG: RnfABCDGE type electron transport complex subunit G [Bacteroidales bacterium]|nr:RnfABCDGE type electron transport complex subunit G [Bacteroidales bacterium]